MEIMDRKTAQLGGFPKYFTGKPCKNGHLVERYTQSGVCQACLRASSSTRVKKVELPEEREAREAFVERRTAILSQLVEVRVLARPGADLDTLYEMAEGLCRARFPDILDMDAVGTRAKVREHPMYSITVPAEDAQLVRDTAGVLWRQVAPDLHAVRHRLQAQAATLGAPVADWAERP